MGKVGQHLNIQLMWFVSDPVKARSSYPVGVVTNLKALWAGSSGTNLMCRGVTIDYQQ